MSLLARALVRYLTEHGVDEGRFDRMTSYFAERGSRRGAIGALAAALGVVGLAGGGESVAGKSKKSGKRDICVDGSTRTVSRQARKRWLKKGATDGPCAPASPPPPPPPPPPIANKQYT